MVTDFSDRELMGALALVRVQALAKRVQALRLAVLIQGVSIILIGLAAKL